MAVHPEGGEAQYRLFTELDKSTKQTLQLLRGGRDSRPGESNVWEPAVLAQGVLKAIGQGSPCYFQQDIFLECAVRLHLFHYVQESIRRPATPLLSVCRTEGDATRLLHIAATSIVDAFVSYGGVPWSIHYVAMMRLFLEAGADPNKKFGDETIWQNIARYHTNVRNPKLPEDLQKAFVEPAICELFLQHGANPDDVEMASMPKDVVVLRPRRTKEKRWWRILRLRKRS